MLSLCHTPEYSIAQRGFSPASDTRGLVTAAQGAPFDLLALEPREACVLECHRFVTIGETVVGGLPPQGTAQTAD